MGGGSSGSIFRFDHSAYSFQVWGVEFGVKLRVWDVVVSTTSIYFLFIYKYIDIEYVYRYGISLPKQQRSNLKL